MKDILKIASMVCLVFVVFICKDAISSFITDSVIYKGSNKVLTYNEYYLDYDYSYVQNVDASSVKSYQDVLNTIYTILNSGDNSYSFYCEYDNCINDIENIISDNKIVSNINNFVHPFNSFDSINVDIENNKKVTITNKKFYSDEEIIYIKTYINEFITHNITEGMNDQTKIKLFHDHIVNNTVYDESGKENKYSAYNLLTEGKSICGGYSDIMSIYLNILGIQNYKISSDNHIWNLINVDGAWYHLDATWDDPIANDGNQYLIHNFFLISTAELLSLDRVEHNFDRNVYSEAK